MNFHHIPHGLQVIITCSGCKNRHLIADHLGWFDSQKKVGTIEDILEAKGETVTRLDPASDDAIELIERYDDLNRDNSKR